MFIYIGNNQKVKEATIKANDIVMNNGEFEQIIKKNKAFDMAIPEDITGEVVLGSMRGVLAERDVFIKIYYPWYRFSRALGYFTTNRPFDINLNGYKLKRSEESVVATLVHELVHMSDNLDQYLSYGHGAGRNANNPKGKSGTAPYWIGNLAASLYGDDDVDILENSTYKKKFSLLGWFKNLLF
jgi:hypothetical protein